MRRKNGCLPRLLLGGLLLGISGGLVWWSHRETGSGTGTSAASSDPYATLQNDKPANNPAPSASAAAKSDPYASLGSTSTANNPPPDSGKVAPPAPPPSMPPIPQATPEAPAKISGPLPIPPVATEVQFSGPLPRSADGWYALGQQQKRAGDHRRAAKAFAQATALNPSAANWRALADEQVALRDYAAQAKK